MARIKELDSLIHAKYDREAGLARDLGWSRQRLNKITNGGKEPDLEEVRVLARQLERPFEEIAFIFLNQKSPNAQHAE